MIYSKLVYAVGTGSRRSHHQSIVVLCKFGELNTDYQVRRGVDSEYLWVIFLFFTHISLQEQSMNEHVLLKFPFDFSDLLCFIYLIILDGSSPLLPHLDQKWSQSSIHRFSRIHELSNDLNQLLDDCRQIEYSPEQQRQFRFFRFPQSNEQRPAQMNDRPTTIQLVFIVTSCITI